ncbi:hypothetical protein HPB49_005101 [Dermacentor silvarum]|uniref:Uncharacterized protein n=1 Tax=Dermacentor silvarum TaxID=543639 RepID=A0ACB8CPZ1_DERSI|nr:hypothetical protein HPB49_005101 [Dermacentor silvarum]
MPTAEDGKIATAVILPALACRMLPVAPSVGRHQKGPSEACGDARFTESERTQSHTRKQGSGKPAPEGARGGRGGHFYAANNRARRSSSDQAPERVQRHRALQEQAGRLSSVSAAEAATKVCGLQLDGLDEECWYLGHFEESAFEQNPADGWKKLKPNAVPTIFSVRAMPKHRKPPRERFLPQVAPATVEERCTLHNQLSASRTSPTALQHQHVNDMAAIQQTAHKESQPLPSDDTEMSQAQMSNSPSQSSTAETSVPATDDSLQVAGPLRATHVELLEEKCSNRSCAEVNKQLQDMKGKYAKLREVHSKASAKTKSIKKKLQKLEYTSGILRKKLKFLNEDQMRALSRNSNRGATWSSKTIKQALQIKFASGTSGYETLRKLGYPLPSNRTLVRRLQGLKFLPRILTEVIDVLRSKAEGMEDVERDCVLYLDEMEIAHGYELKTSCLEKKHSQQNLMNLPVIAWCLWSED